MRILSIDGGGIRGLIPALVLACIERLAGKPMHQLVDLVAGTSTGGIIAAAVGAGIPMATVASLYLYHARSIFARPLAHRIASLGGLVDEQYPADALEDCLQGIFGDKRLRDCTIPTLVTSWDLGMGAAVLFKSTKAQTDKGRDYLLRSVCRATSAAPTYFEPAVVKSADGVMRTLVDGGVCANNPAMVALIEAYKLAPHADVALLSLGTGAQPCGVAPSEAKSWGLIRAARPVLDLLMAGPTDIVDYQCRTVLADRYHRLQAILPRPMAMDATDSDSLALLEAQALRITESDDFAKALAVLGVVNAD
ncbi:patatin-like phospholipase family protein [Fundidesulfovibrio butyratiphilus]